MYKMKIAFFSENGLQGKCSRDFDNCRTEFAWMIALDADHYNIFNLPAKTENYDIGIIILPKKNINKIMQSSAGEIITNMCKKVSIMQEGPNWFWQDYSMEEQIWYFNSLASVDFLLAHNESDVNYYSGLAHKSVYAMPSLMIEDTIKDLPEVERDGRVIIGGNMTSWYGGFDSMVIAEEFKSENTIYAPSMGRKIDREEELDITHFPYMNWTEWIYKLNNMTYAVHLMRTHAAGTFALNCAYLGIPCIGYKGLDTQEKCFPWSTVELGDMSGAKKNAEKLRDDKEFYDTCSEYALFAYQDYYTEEKFKEKMYKIFEKELDE